MTKKKIIKNISLIKQKIIENHMLMKELFPEGLKFKHGNYNYEILNYNDDFNSSLYNSVHVNRSGTFIMMDGITRMPFEVSENYLIETIVKWKIN